VRQQRAAGEAYEAIQPEVVTLSLRVGQSRPVYRALKELREGPGGRSRSDLAAHRVGAGARREPSGVGLEGDNRPA
jgi:oligopeptidase A